jgi:hypothetical protein
MKDTYLRLMNDRIESHLNHQEGVFLVDVAGNSKIEATGDSIVESIGANVSSRMDGEKTVLQVGPDVRVEYNVNKTITLSVGATKITITEGAITISGDPAIIVNSQDVTFNCSNFTVNANDTVNIKAAPLNINAVTHITGATDISGETKIAGNTKITGAVNVAGDLDAALFKKTPPELGKTANEPTAGVLTTGSLYQWDDFVGRLVLEGGNIHFIMEMGSTKLEFIVEHADIISEAGEAGKYEWLAETINQEMIDEYSAVGSCIYFRDDFNDERLRFQTSGVGKEKGFVTYLQDVTTNAGSTPGVLTCGSISSAWADFVTSLGNLGLAFKIVTDGKTLKYLIEYSEISALGNFESLATVFDDLYPDLSAAFTASKFVFTTKGTGRMDGTIDYLQATDTPSSPAELISGSFSLSYEQFVNTLDGKDWAIYLPVDNHTYTLLRMNDDILNDSSLENFFANLIAGKPLTVKVSVNNVIFYTKSVGAGATIDFPINTGTVPGEPAALTTGLLLDFSSIQQAYGPGTANITFFLTVDDVRYDYLITPANLKAAAGWPDLIQYFSSSTDIKITYSNGCYVFTYHEKGRRTFSYLQYDGDGKTTIDGATLLLGIEPFAVIDNGNDDDYNIYPDSVGLFALGRYTGATVKNGEDVAYRTDSTIILKGTSASGASVAQGKDGQITMINNSGTLLKGTKETDADLKVGLDPGEDPPGEFDGKFTLVGELEVIEGISCKKITSSQGADITGAITLTPRTVPEDEDTQPEVTDVIIDGGLKVTTLTVVESASLGKSVFNDGIEVNGDIKIDNGTISSNGITISFNSKLNVNSQISASDFLW